MTPYSYECPTDGEFVVYAPMGEAPREAHCETCGGRAPRILVVNWSFPYGREQFHGATIRERQDRHIATAKADGVGIEPVGARWV